MNQITACSDRCKGPLKRENHPLQRRGIIDVELKRQGFDSDQITLRLAEGNVSQKVKKHYSVEPSSISNSCSTASESITSPRAGPRAIFPQQEKKPYSVEPSSISNSSAKASASIKSSNSFGSDSGSSCFAIASLTCVAIVGISVKKGLGPSALSL